MGTEEKLNGFVDKLLDSAEAIVDFGKEQLPQYFEEVARMEYITSLGWGWSLVALAVITFVVSFILIWRGIKQSDSDIVIPGCFGMIIFASIFVFSVGNFWDAYKAKNFPKITIVEYLVELKGE